MRTLAKILAILLAATALGIYASPAPVKNQLADLPVIGTWLTQQQITLGLDLQGGTRLTYRVVLDDIPAKDHDTVVNGVADILTRRVNALGVSEPNIYESRLGQDRYIVVELAGIKDIEEAKKIVGKTIQLDFKEQDPAPDNTALRQDMEKKAKAFLAAAQKSPDSFAKLFEDFKAPPRTSLKEDTEFVWMDSLPENSRDAILKAPVGTVIDQLFQPAEGSYTQTPSGGFALDSSFTVYRVIAREDAATRTEHLPEERTASHTLIAFKGASKAADSITRTEEEARLLAEEVLKKAQNGEKLADLAMQYSDEPGAKESKGSLDSFKRGAMVPQFEQAAFDMKEPGLVQRIVRTEFGYHIIEVTKITPEDTTSTTEPRVKLARATFSAVADGFRSTGLTGAHFRRADVGSDPQTYQPIVQISFTATSLAENKLNIPHLIASLGLLLGGIVFVFALLGLLTHDGSTSRRTLIAVTILSALITGVAAYFYLTLKEDAAPAPAEQSSNTDATGVELFKDITARNVNKPLAIYLDGYPIIDTNGDGVINAEDPAYAPTVRSEITTGQATISGLASLKEAYTLANNLNTGAIPAPIRLSSEQTIGASLGAEALHKSLLAGALGILAIWVFMTIVYRLPGFISGIALVIYGILLVAAIQYIGVVMTLAGMAGIILSFGMAIDANVLIFARMREELKNGKSLDHALHDGFTRAWSSIWAGNVSTLITCFILFLLGSSVIKGFAVTLSLGVILSMLSAITVTRIFLSGIIATPIRHLRQLF